TGTRGRADQKGLPIAAANLHSPFAAGAVQQFRQLLPCFRIVIYFHLKACCTSAADIRLRRTPATRALPISHGKEGAPTRLYPSVALTSARRVGSFSSTASRTEVSTTRETIPYNCTFSDPVYQGGKGVRYLFPRKTGTRETGTPNFRFTD